MTDTAKELLERRILNAVADAADKTAAQYGGLFERMMQEFSAALRTNQEPSK